MIYLKCNVKNSQAEVQSTPHEIYTLHHSQASYCSKDGDAIREQGVKGYHG